MEQKIINERWKDFAIRMAKTVFKRNKKVLSDVESYLASRTEEGYTCTGWDRGVEPDYPKFGYCMSSDFEEYFSEYVKDNGEFYAQGNKVASCLRAGIDMANPDKWGGGVVGFCIGDLKKMYPEGIPEWIKDNYKSKLIGKDEDPIWL